MQGEKRRRRIGESLARLQDRCQTLTYRNSRVPFSDAVVEEIEWELWNWYCWLLAVGLPPDSIEFGALYMRGRWHASEYAAAGEVPAFHDM